MDITTPAVAATQFTAYMAMLNLVISYTSWWQGFAIERIGYPQTLVARLGGGPVRAAPAAADAAVPATGGHRGGDAGTGRAEADGAAVLTLTDQSRSRLC